MKMRPRAGICGLCLGAIFAVGAQAQSIIDQGSLESVTVGDFVRLTGMLKKPAETVCILSPYQSSVRDTESVGWQINAHLRATSYVADEGHWALAFVKGDTVDVQKFRRSERLDMEAGDASLPLSFRPRNCVVVDRAGITKVRRSGRNYLILGEMQ